MLKEGKTNWKYILIVVILAVMVIGAIFYYYPRLKLPPFKPSKLAKEFTIDLEEEAKIIYERGEFLLSFENVDTQEGSIELNLLESGIYSSCFFPEDKTFDERAPNTLMLNEQVHCFTSVECSIVFKLIALENTKTTFKTWESCAPPGPKGPFLPKDIIITEKETPYIKVISPNGGEEWSIGNTYEIKWSSSYPSTEDVGIAFQDTRYGLFSESPLGEVVITHTQNTGSYTWMIPPVLEDSLGREMELGAGSVYRIEIFVARPGAECLSDRCDGSDNLFSIVAE